MSIIKKSFSSDKYEALYLVDEEHHGMRLDQFLQIYLASFSRQAVKQKIKDKDIIIHNRPGTHKPSTILHHKDKITLYTYKTVHEDEWWNGEKLELQLTPDIIYQDDDLAVISKPPYMATHPTGKHIFNCATVFFEAQTNRTAHSIHRIDRETSGVLLLGKNPKTANLMTECFENDQVKKCYLFIAQANEDYNEADYLECDRRLGATDSGLKRIYINHFPVDSTEGKHAFTRFKIVHKENGYVIGLAFPQTGRQHQIRVHAMINGLPLIGDKLYLGNFKMFQRFKDNIASKEDHDLMQLSRHALHAIALRIPYQGKETIFKAPIPNDLQEWLKSNTSIALEKLEELLSIEIDSYFNNSLK
jgi:RluA family pseudouridine synthase